MEQNIFEICNNNCGNQNNIAKIKVEYCGNLYCLFGFYYQHKWNFDPKMCKNCGSIICHKCISNNHDKCVICSFPNLNLKLQYKKQCKNCAFNIFVYMCKKCNRPTLYCDPYCEYSMYSFGTSKLIGYCCKNCDDYDKSFAKFIKFNEIEFQ